MVRKKRPIARPRAYRNARLFVIACEDRYVPKDYFEGLRSSQIHVEVLATEDGQSDPRSVADRLVKYRARYDLDTEDDELWLV